MKNVNATLGKKFSFTFYQLNHKKNVSVFKKFLFKNIRFQRRINQSWSTWTWFITFDRCIWYGKLLNAMHCIQAAVA